MDNKKLVILTELKKVAKTINKQRFTRDEFIKNSQIPISKRDIENCGGFPSLMLEASLRPQKHHKISNEELFKAYEIAYKKIGHFPLGHPGEAYLEKVTNISGGVYRKRFGGLKNLIFEYKNWLLEKQVSPHNDVTTGLTKIVQKRGEVVKTDGFENKQRFIGKATENLVVAELLFRGFNAQLLQVDEGIDVFALNVKNNELYLIQVKHASYEITNKSCPISITVSSFEKNKKGNVFYIFVLEREVNKRMFLILPFLKIDELIKNRSIIINNDSKQFSFRVLHQGSEDAYIGNISESTNVSRYLNAWDVLL